MIKKCLSLIVSLVCICLVSGSASGVAKLKVIINVSTSHELSKIVVESTDLGGYATKKLALRDAITTYIYEDAVLEPQHVKVLFYWRKKNATSISFWAYSGVYYVNVKSSDNKPLLTATSNSKVLNKIQEIEKRKSALDRELDSLVKNINYETYSVAEAEKKTYQYRDSINLIIDERIYKRTIALNSESFVGLYALCKYSERPYVNQRVKSQPEKIQQLVDGLGLKLKNLPSAKTLSGKLALAFELQIGNSLPNIVLPDTAGKLFDLSYLKGRYVLIDFWASWCIPCREENPQLKIAYQKYKNLGFEIVSVTQDERSLKKNWLNAIDVDKIDSWTHLSDFNGLAKATYGTRFIPANYLVVPTGKIIARDLRGADLVKELSKIYN